MDELLQKQTILIVDDSPENITILGELLKSEHVIRVATSGEKALKIVFSDSPPDIILLDVMMPGMDGYEVCRVLKDNPRARSIPIIFLTAKSAEADEVKGFEAGAVDYITKPFSPVVVKARVNTHVELKKYRDYLENTSYLDGLTGIANRRRFEEYYAAVWNFMIRENSPLSLIMIDIDHFKQYNDYYGHQAGDACLKNIAHRLSESVKRKIDLVARYGGEEFVCVLPNTGIMDAAVLAERLRKEVELLLIPHAVSPVGDYITISQGIASLMPAADMARDILIKLADQELYKAKQAGRNRLSVAK